MNAPLRVGDRVRHHHHGVGEITQISPQGGHAVVRFKTPGGSGDGYLRTIAIPR
jgi:hypothetical protein